MILNGMLGRASSDGNFLILQSAADPLGDATRLG
jgi:hypothetical protein